MRKGMDMQDIKNSIEIIKKEVQKVTDLLYKQQNNAGMNEMNELLSELSNITVIITRYIQDGSLQFDLNQYIEILTNAMHALEEKDTTLLADILQYDLLEQINGLEESINTI